MKYDPDPKILKNQVLIETYKSRGPGGQRKNKVETAIRLKHIPSGITVVATEHRSQKENKRLAFKRLQERLIRLNQPKKQRLRTSIPSHAIERRMGEKKIISKKKILRRRLIKELEE